MGLLCWSHYKQISRDLGNTSNVDGRVYKYMKVSNKLHMERVERVEAKCHHYQVELPIIDLSTRDRFFCNNMCYVSKIHM